jgi:hypothetical protein
MSMQEVCYTFGFNQILSVAAFVLYLSLSKVRSSARVHRTNVLLSGQDERKACVHVLRVVLNVVTDIIDSSEAPI